jgi:hypothetical protein
MAKPEPDFTIEELALEALSQVPEGADGVFTNAELRILFGCAKDTVYKRLDTLASLGWKFVPTRKKIIDRVGKQTHTMGYKFIPPSAKAPSN